MQPYFFPYLGYWQLLHAVDTFVIFDDVNYKKKGYIDRNTILVNGNPTYIKLEIVNSSQNRLINSIILGNNRTKLLKTIELAYKKSDCFNIFFPEVEKILKIDEGNLAKFLEHSIRTIADFLQINTKIVVSSEINCAKSGSEKIIPLVKDLRGDTYINMNSGRNLYKAKDFFDAGIGLEFLDTYQTPYQQHSANRFVPNLSILDLLFNLPSTNVRSRLSPIK